MKFEIEPGIRPLCDELNAIEGVQTLWSCEGHPHRPSRPYVIFEAPEDVALRIHRALGIGDGNGALKYVWWLTANFRANGQLQWCIEPNCEIPFWRYLPCVRGSLDSELRRLASLIRTSIS